MERTPVRYSGGVDPDRLALARAALVAQPVSFAEDKVLAVLDPLRDVLPRAGLVRGQIVSCQGAAAMSLALALAAGPTDDGSWAAVIGLPSVGVQAAAELGMALERTVFVAAPPSDQWGVVLGAAIDGADVVIAAAPTSSAAATEARRLQARLQARGGVLVVVGEPGPFHPDLVLASNVIGWEGLGDGHGHLVSRRIVIQVGGRRAGRPSRHELLVPGPDGAVESVRSMGSTVALPTTPVLSETG